MSDDDFPPEGPNPVAYAVLAFLVAAALGLTTCAARADIIVTDDLGGFVEKRMREVDGMRARGEGAIIPYGRCISACTLYLGLPKTCVGREAVFGFHGPAARTQGLGLPLGEFERVSQAMARYYPAPIRDWYLSTARHIIGTYYKVTGAQLIALGAARECQK